MPDSINKSMTVIGYTCLTVILLVMVAIAIWILFLPELPMLLRVLLWIGAIGFVALLVVVLRQRIADAKEKSYDDVEV